MKTITVTLKTGFTIAGKTHKECELREPSTDDLFEAEDIAGTDTPLKFNGALITRVLERAGDYKGPFTLAMIRSLPRGDFALLRNALDEAAKLGEG